MLATPAQTITERTLAWWEAANYLTVAQIYLQDNPLLDEPLRPEHIKPRLLGHWGTSPGLNLIYAHLNNLIRETGQEVLFVAGPGHGGPAVVANVYLEGSYSAVYPEVTRDRPGLRRLVRQFSTPGGIPSHVSAPTPGSIHEGGELGYSLVHAFGAAFDNPDLLVACVIGDGEAETAALEASWKGTRFLNPGRDGAVLPILHLNENKISGPTVLGRASDDEIAAYLAGHGYAPVFVEGHEVQAVHMHFERALAAAYEHVHQIQHESRSGGPRDRPTWPAIVLRTPKGWTGPAKVDGVPVEGTFRSHQVPLPGVRESAEHLAQLEAWLRSYHPHEHFDENGTLIDELAALAPPRDKRMGAIAHANGGRLRRPLALRQLANYELAVDRPGVTSHETTRPLGEMLRDLAADNRGRFRLFSPDETNSNRLGAIFEVEDRCLMDARPEDDHVSSEGRVMEVLSEHLCQGWLEGYTLTGRHGLFATYEAFAMVSASMAIQHAKWLEAAEEIPWRWPVSSLNVLLTSTCWRNDHNGFSHQGPGLIDTMISLRGSVVRVYMPPDANTLLSVAEHCLDSTDYVNLIVADKQQHLQYLDLNAARRHAADGISVWDWAGTAGDEEPDVILASIGDVPTLEALAASALLRERVPELRVRFVNVVDLMRLTPSDVHPHGLSEAGFEDIFGADHEVVVAFHGYARALHQLVHGRRHPGRFHVRGFREQGTTTTPFDMTVLNGMSRYHLAVLALERSRRRLPGTEACIDHCDAMLERHGHYVREHFEDLPEIRDWIWHGVVRLDRIAVVNAGSSSLKLRLLDADDRVLERRDLDNGADYGAALTGFVESVGEIAAIGHRVVHGGAEFVAPTPVDARVEHRLEALCELAPVHNSLALEAIRATMRMRPATPNVACFDTAFHATLPAEARTYALPGEWVERWGLRRFGFHGLSHTYAARRAAELLGRPLEELRLVTAHLGAGASLAAIQAGRSIDTTMGFTPLEGLVMATRSGSVDPGLILWLQKPGRLAATEVEDGLEHAAGLLGISGRTGDMRAILAGLQAGDESCRLAFDVYSHRLAAGVAAMAASLGGIDALAFTGGVGENIAEVRAEACRRLAFLGLGLDDDANRAARPDSVIADGRIGVPTLVVGAREDIEIAAGVRAALGTAS